MAEIFILWSGEDGQTRRIVQTIEDVVRGAGHRLEVVNAEAPPAHAYFSKPDALVVAAWGEGGDYSPALSAALQRMNGRLAATPSAFLSVSLMAAAPGREEDAEELAAAFPADMGWKPTIALSEAGALRYPEYGFRQRRAMKRAAKRLGLPRDTSRVHEFTDWARVRAFAAQVIELAAGRFPEAAALDAEAGQLYDLAG